MTNFRMDHSYTCIDSFGDMIMLLTEAYSLAPDTIKNLFSVVK